MLVRLIFPSIFSSGPSLDRSWVIRCIRETSPITTWCTAILLWKGNMTRIVEAGTTKWSTKMKASIYIGWTKQTWAKHRYWMIKDEKENDPPSSREEERLYSRYGTNFISEERAPILTLSFPFPPQAISWILEFLRSLGRQVPLPKISLRVLYRSSKNHSMILHSNLLILLTFEVIFFCSPFSFPFSFFVAFYFVDSSS